MSSQGISGSNITLEDIFRDLPRKDGTRCKWTVCLGTQKWQKPFLVLTMFETCDDGKDSWVYYGRIDAIQQEGNYSNDNGLLTMLNSTKDAATIFVVDPKNFSGDHAKRFCSVDVDDIVKNLKSSSIKREWDLVADHIIHFIDKRHNETCVSAIRKAKEILRVILPERYPPGKPRSSSKRRGETTDGGQQESGFSGKLSQRGGNPPNLVAGGGRRESSDQGGRQTEGSEVPSGGQVLPDRNVELPDVTILPEKPRPTGKKARLEKVPTMLESSEAMSSDSRAKYQDDLMTRCAVQENTITVDIDQLIPPVRDKSVLLPPYQVRHIQQYFLSQLTRRMKTVGASPLATPFVLLVDPEECPTRKEWSFQKKDEYHYWVIGGNHSACAKADLALLQPNNRQYRRVQSFIFAGLTIHDARNLAWCTNIDSEFRSQMTTIQRLQYIHLRFEENDYVSNQEFKSQCAVEMNLKDWGVRKNADVLNAHDNLFQLAFRRDPEWSYIRQIFDKWELCQIKGQKGEKQAKKSGKEKGSGEAKAPFEEMKLTDWRLMQSIKDSDILVPVLKRVVDGELSLPQMGAEFTQHKIGGKVQKAFLASLQEESWSACKLKYPDHCNDNFLQNFVPTFANWKESTGKRRSASVEERELVSYPDRFNAHIQQAQNWLKMKKANMTVTSTIPDELKCIVFEHPDLGDIFYEIYSEDATKLHEFITKRTYTLAVADIPYGFSVAGCLHEDSVAWDEEQLSMMVQSFKIVSKAKLWRFAVLHSVDQVAAVHAVLKECNGGIQNCIWVKDNVKNAGGARLNSNFEMFTIGFHSVDGGRTLNHFNFESSETRSNVINTPAVTSKLKHSGDKKVVNVYQKPRALLDWIVNHFSFPGDWVLDLCSGSGTSLASSLARGRHCVAIKVDKRQSSVLKGRVLSLDVLLDGDSKEDLTVQNDETATILPLEDPVPEVSGSGLGDKDASTTLGDGQGGENPPEE